MYNLNIFRGRHLNSVLAKVYSHVLNDGELSSPRGQQVIEARRPVVIDLEAGRSPWTKIPGRKLNPYFALAEAIWILAGRKDVNFISYYNKNMPQFSSNGIDFDGAYGDRLRNWPEYYKRDLGFYYSDDDRKTFELDCIDQIALVCKRLSKDPKTRQAVLCLWDPARDLKEGSKDYPCNNLCYFSLRDGCLDMSVIRRSNDMLWGLPYNQIQFYFLHALIAGELGVFIGHYTEFVQNMHVYTENYPELLEKIRARFKHVRDSTDEFTVPTYRAADMRISLSQFETFKKMFFELETDWRCMYPEIKASQVRKIAELMEAEGVPEFWSRTMLYVPMAHIAKKRGNAALHDFLVSQVDPELLWLIEDFTTKKENQCNGSEKSVN